MSRQISIRLSDALMARIDRQARRERRKRSDLIREALTSEFETADDGATALWIDRVRHLVGAVPDLPPGLASNLKEHLRGLGHGRRRSAS